MIHSRIQEPSMGVGGQTPSNFIQSMSKSEWVYFFDLEIRRAETTNQLQIINKLKAQREV